MPKIPVPTSQNPAYLKIQSFILDDDLRGWVGSLQELTDDSPAWHSRMLSRTTTNPHYDLALDSLSALACPHLKGGRIKLWVPDAVSAHRQELRRKWMPVVLEAATQHRTHLPAELSAFLGSVALDEAWRTMLESETETRILANALLAYVDARAPRFSSARQKSTLVQLRAAVDPMVLEILNDWLKPIKPWTILPSSDELLSCCFGQGFSAIHSLVGDDLCAVVNQERPSFLAGLCPAQSTIRPVSLPDLQA